MSSNKEIFHRKANSSTQTVSIAVKQNTNKELRGRGAFGGLPAALAFLGTMDSQQQGTQFTTSIPYASNGHPEWAYWYLPKDGGDINVRELNVGQDSYACIDINPEINRYSCK